MWVAFCRGERARRRGPLIRPLIDGTAFFAAFLLATAATSVPLSAMPSAVTAALTEQVQSLAVTTAAAGNLPPTGIATTRSPLDSQAVIGRTSAGTAWILLGLALSVLAALDMAIVRHLRLLYAPVRRRRPPR